MNHLIIYANPTHDSFTYQTMQAYTKRLDPATVDIIDLYEDQQEFLQYSSKEVLREWELENAMDQEKRRSYQQRISDADELVFIFPIRWGSMPAILKNFIDVNFTAWFAFKFTGWPLPEKLLTGKTAKIFTHCDAPAFFYKRSIFSWMNIKKYMKQCILGYCWIKVTDFKLLWRLRNRDETYRTRYLENITTYNR